MEERLERLETRMERICFLLQEIVKPVRQKRIEQTVLAELRTERIKYLRAPLSGPPRTAIQYNADLEERRAELEELDEEVYIAQEVKKRLKNERTKKNPRSRLGGNEIYDDLEELEKEDYIVLGVKDCSKE